ncbi:spore coat protein [Falsibacillus pallidus]|uniref:Coat F domain-containing protein n=1 Tax=Falsibacillus pallidus TaxID=493781 RepID=A0A370GDV6_9BACI|nr:spore coat protein [Falsibacillus pallidus]RDI41420.1 coat F domain-containing protein [Falsibacillus pallidus]
MQNQQQNTQNTVPIPQTPQMNDRDLINDVLAMEKYMTASYCTALNEASHDALYQDLLAIFTETQNAQRQLFNTMYQKGWYKLDQAELQKLQQSSQKHQSYSSQFPYGTHLQ